MLGVGYAPTKGEVDQGLGDMVLALRNDLDVTKRLYIFVTKSIANGYLASLGYTSDQITFINRVVNDLYTLSLIGNGTATQPALYNFFDAAEELAGVK